MNAIRIVPRPTNLALPGWARFRQPPTDLYESLGIEPGPDDILMNGQAFIVDVDAADFYPAILAEYREAYGARRPGDMQKSEWDDPLNDLLTSDVDSVSAYWLEVAYQSMKLDLQMACRTFALNIHVHDVQVGEDGPMRFQQSVRPPGRGTKKAAGGLNGGREARAHYKRLRGFFPG